VQVSTHPAGHFDGLKQLKFDDITSTTPSLLHPEVSPGEIALIAESPGSGQDHLMHELALIINRVRHADGSVHAARFTYIPDRQPDGQIRSFISSIDDIAAKRAPPALPQHARCAHRAAQPLLF
jgi:hypothetical protein